MSETTVNSRDKFIPWYFVGFFAVLFVMDGIFVFLATSTHTGVVTEQAYQKGLNYNETVAASADQAALGWSGTIRYSDTGALEFKLDGQTGEPLTGAQVVAEFFRPTHNGSDFSIPLQELQAGHYAAAVKFPLEGQWDVRVFVTWNQQQYQQGERLIIR